MGVIKNYLYKNNNINMLYNIIHVEIKLNKYNIFLRKM